MKSQLLWVCSAICLLLLWSCKKDSTDYSHWQEYLGGPDRNHYTTLDQITLQNVSHLKIAWTYATPDSGQMQMSPIVVDGLLYGVTASVQAFAVDAATGKEIWRFGDPEKIWHSTSRGVAYWTDGVDDKRILFTAGPNLFALDAKTGVPIESFGNNGKIDLHLGLPESAKDKFIISNTPGTIFEDLIIMPVRLSEGADAGPGDVRAFNVITGQLAWTFHTIPYPGEEGYETWENKEAYLNTDVGAANNWAGMAIDRGRGVVYIPIGSAAPDFYGGHRKGENLYANCLLALDARTGKKKWSQQLVHHDIWDRDPPAPPNLIRVKRSWRYIDAVAQVTKQGYVFVFDRDTGTPLFDIKEVKMPGSTLEGEAAWPTQPIPVLPKPYARQSSELTENDLSPYAENKDSLLALFRKLDKRPFAPPSLGGNLLLPGYDGGAEWGGAGADPRKGILYVNANEMAWILQMEIANASAAAQAAGEAGYITYCAVCHKNDLKGSTASGYPSLVEISKKRTKTEVLQLMTTGKGMMPGFPQISDKDKKAIAAFLFGEEKKEVAVTTPSNGIPPLPYGHTGYDKFLDSNGLPGINPPWGTLSAIDLNTGEFLWRVTLGDTDSLKQKGFPPTGTENYGGPIITSNGLLFIAATKDGKFRAFNRKTGELVWETTLPAASFTTPATYEINGKQYIALACGGEKLGTPKGNLVVAFALE